MKRFSDMIEDIKDIVSLSVNGSVKDQAIAEELNMTTSAFATAKSRNKIPYEAISIWAAKKKVAINSILFDQDVESLVAPTNDLLMHRYHLVH